MLCSVGMAMHDRKRHALNTPNLSECASVCTPTTNTTNRSVYSHTCVSDGCRLQHLKCLCEVCVECREVGLQGQQVS